MKDLILNTQDSLQGEKLEVFYVPVSQVIRWEDNPKLHDLGAIINSIELNGFRDPPSYDATLDALVEGNGRATALDMMERQARNVPRGILTHNETGVWYMPINFGINAETREKAIAYAIDHNNLTMAGGDYTAFDFMRMWNSEQYTAMLTELGHENMPVTVSYDDLQVMLDGGFDIDDFNDDDYDEDEAYKPKVVKVSIAEHGIVDDVIQAIKTIIEENSWDESVNVS
jgi:hypothetical protein